MLQQAKRAFETVNLSGKFHDTMLNSNGLMTAQVTKRVALGLQRQRSAARSAPRTPTGGVDSVFVTLKRVGTRAKADLQGGLGAALHLQRNVPLFWLVGGSPNVFGSVTNVASPWYPIGELLVGRGHTSRQPVASNDVVARQASWFQRFSHAYDQLSYHGLAGAIVEEPFLRTAHRFEHEGRLEAATACMMAAVVGRAVLQIPRLMVCAAAWVNGVVVSLTVVVAAYAAQCVLGFMRDELTKVQRATGAHLQHPIDKLSGWHQAIDLLYVVDAALTLSRDTVGVTDTPVIDPAHAASAKDLIRERFPRDARRFMAVADDSFATAQQERAHVRAVAEEIAQSYRMMTRRLPNHQALRFGLQMLKDFVSAQWQEDYFEPLELR